MISGTSFRKHLSDLISIPSPSEKEGPVAEWCEKVLTDLGFEVEIDHVGNLLAVRDSGSWILLNAHMDTVQDVVDVGKIRSGGLTRPRLDLSYGFDDKVGIAIILTLAEIEDLPFKVLLTVEEETGGRGVKAVGPEFFDNVTGCVTLDRGGYDDMVTSILGKSLAHSEWIDDIDRVLRKGGFVFNRVAGRMCDAYTISEHVPTINLSVGIYEMHTKYEYVKVEQSIRTAKAVLHLLKSW